MVTVDGVSVSDDEISLRSECELSFSYAASLILTHISDKCRVFRAGGWWWLDALRIESILLILPLLLLLPPPPPPPPPTPSLVRIPTSLPARVENWLESPSARMLCSEFNANSLSGRRFLTFSVSQTVDMSTESVASTWSTEFSKVCF